MEFLGHSALVTGAAQGVGRAVADLLAERGARVLSVDVVPRDAKDHSRDANSAPDASGHGPAVHERLVDLSDPVAVQDLASEIQTAPDEVDLLVNCAAAYPPGGILATTDDDWSRVLQVNVLAAATLARAVAGRLVHAGRPGAIVNVGSVQETLPLPDHSAYVVSKGALTAMNSALAVELGEHGIRVNQVTLGLVNSPALQAKLGTDIWAESPPPTLLGRTGTVDEAAEAVAFLCSPRASYITGAVLAVDGGRRLSRRPDPQLDTPEGPARHRAPTSRPNVHLHTFDRTE